VDGAAVSESHDRFERLIGGTAPIGIARLRQMRNEGARFNIGSIRRNFNDPMFPLRVIEPDNQRRFKFALAGHETVDGAAASKISFDESTRPSLIQDNGRDRPSRGTVWLGSGGAVLRTRLEVGDRQRGMTATIVVDYRRDPKLEMLVPGAMHEIYMAITANDTSGPLGAVGERIDCEATYTNFRRFETAARIVPDR
jgi:hypothetical protein